MFKYSNILYVAIVYYRDTYLEYVMHTLVVLFLKGEGENSQLNTNTNMYYMVTKVCFERKVILC